MIAEILATGDEVLTGTIIDSNSAYISERLEEAGLEVVRHTSVGDDMERLVAVLKEIGARAEVCVVTGGLGPTVDDLTAVAAAEAAGVEPVLDEAAFVSMEKFFQARKLPMTPSNRKQAMLPAGSVCLANPVGTAPGFYMKIGGCPFFFLPGVPSEMRTMLSNQVLPRIATLRGRERSVSIVKTVSTFGLTESAAGERLAGFTGQFDGIKIGLRVKFPEIQVKLYGRGEDAPGLRRLLEKASGWAMERLGGQVISPEGAPMEAVVGDLLRRQNATIAVAESCTGGLISHMLTGVAGSSDYFLFSGVTYSNASKMKVLGVSAATLKQYGAVHEETAREMADGARRVAGATYGLATTGIAGPSGGTPAKPVGTVCIGLATPNGAQGSRFDFTFGQRSMNKKIFAVKALDLIRRELLKGCR